MMVQLSYYQLLAEQLAEQYNVSNIVIEADNAHIRRIIPNKKEVEIDCRWSSGNARQQQQLQQVASISSNGSMCDSSNQSTDSSSLCAPSLPRRSITPPSGHLYEIMRGGKKPTHPERKSSPTKKEGRQPLPRVPRRHSSKKKVQIAEKGEKKDVETTTTKVPGESKRISRASKRKIQPSEIGKDRSLSSKSWPGPKITLRDAMSKSLSSSNLLKGKQHSPPEGEQPSKVRPSLATTPKQSSIKKLMSSFRKQAHTNLDAALMSPVA